MWQVPIVEEIRQLRQEYAAQFNHDLKAICHDLRQRQKQSNHKLVALPPKPAGEPVTTDGPSDFPSN